jgi:hypothetical protein
MKIVARPKRVQICHFRARGDSDLYRGSAGRTHSEVGVSSGGGHILRPEGETQEIHDDLGVKPGGSGRRHALDLETQMEGTRFSIGLRNSHDKSLRLG